MEIKSCETCKFERDVNFCKCVFVEDVENCPYYKKYEPTPSADEISSEE